MMTLFKRRHLPFLLFCLVFQTLVSTIAISQTQEKITEAESKQLQDVAAHFTRRLEESRDFAPLLNEFYVKDFTERFVKQRQKELSIGPVSPKIFYFAPGLQCQQSLLEQATPEDWRRFYVAAHNFILHGFFVAMNKSAPYLLKDQEPDEKIYNDLYPKKAIAFLNAHPILKNFVLKKDNRPIRTIDEMRDVIATLEQASKIVREETGNHPTQLTSEANRLKQQISESDLALPSVEVVEEAYYGFPKGTRLFHVVTPLLLRLELVRVNGEYRILWVEAASQ